MPPEPQAHAQASQQAQKIEKDDEWLSVFEAADVIGVTSNTMKNWARQKVGPPFYVFYLHYRYKLNEIKEWIETKRVLTEEPLVRVLSVEEASNLMKVNKRTLYIWMSAGRGPPKYMFNGKYVFKEGDVLKWIEENKDAR